MKRKDLILIAMLVLAAAIGGVFYYLRAQKLAGEIVITVDGKEYDRLPLGEDQTLTIENGNGETNILRIENGYAIMTEASCPDHLCVHQGEIHLTGETIVCLPNKVIVEVKGTVDDGLDGIAR